MPVHAQSPMTRSGVTTQLIANGIYLTGSSMKSDKGYAKATSSAPGASTHVTLTAYFPEGKKVDSSVYIMNYTTVTLYGSEKPSSGYAMHYGYAYNTKREFSTYFS